MKATQSFTTKVFDAQGDATDDGETKELDVVLCDQCTKRLHVAQSNAAYSFLSVEHCNDKQWSNIRQFCDATCLAQYISNHGTF